MKNGEILYRPLGLSNIKDNIILQLSSKRRVFPIKGFGFAPDLRVPGRLFLL